ncbi:hypothetical protein [Methylobacterium sp. J-076]|uniref:hypothetical protein n=1 Tax=Methylobacterium sp. J-076 TaxID=2836655 RepID=UPI001FB99F2D|nr:hypothetical protein [Methylobacterium sp. J-076]MCJ2013539.1 hypothetical protein [Methylobacterium sp. J-076]
MRHPRVRRPFIVESRGSSRDGNSVAIPKRVPPSPQLQSKIASESVRLVFDPWAAVSAPSEPTAAARRILPNIMAPPEPDPLEPEAMAPPREAALPRVRRAKPRAAVAAPRPAALAEAPAATPPRPVAIAEPARDTAAPPSLRPSLRTDRSGRAALPAGQRWKARLPRACW